MDVLSKFYALTEHYSKTKFVLVICIIKSNFWLQIIIVINFFCSSLSDLEYFEFWFQKFVNGVFFLLHFYHLMRVKILKIDQIKNFEIPFDSANMRPRWVYIQVSGSSQEIGAEVVQRVALEYPAAVQGSWFSYPQPWTKVPFFLF